MFNQNKKINKSVSEIDFYLENHKHCLQCGKPVFTGLNVTEELCKDCIYDAGIKSLRKKIK